MTLAELVRAAGHFVEIGEGQSARDHELALQATFLNFNLVKYSLEREPGDMPWSFIVSDPRDAEQAHGISIYTDRGLM
jgi:hypothetical protein